MKTVELYLTPSKEANDYLKRDPFALLLGMLLDQQIPMERAFAAPFLLSQRLAAPGQPIDPCTLSSLPEERVIELFSARPALHRFPRAMAAKAAAVAAMICGEYAGDTAALWLTAPTGDALLARLKALPGFGEEKARIFLALLGKRLGATPPGWREAATPFAEPGTFQSVADSDSPGSLEKIRLYKAAIKAQKPK